MNKSTETLREFLTRKAADAEARTVARRISIGATPSRTLVGYEPIERLIDEDARYAEWETVKMIHSDSVQPDEVAVITLTGYVMERLVAYRVPTSTSTISNYIDSARVAALQEVLRQLQNFGK